MLGGPADVFSTRSHCFKNSFFSRLQIRDLKFVIASSRFEVRDSKCGIKSSRLFRHIICLQLFTRDTAQAH